MKNYLLKITCLGTLCFGLMITSCSDDDSEDPTIDQEQIDSNSDSPNDEGQVDDDGSSGDGGTTTALTSECLFCQGFTFSQNNSSGNITVVYLEGNVCKGEDGKAYYEDGAPVDELGQTYEDHIAFLGRQARTCSEIQN